MKKNLNIVYCCNIQLYQF